MATATLKKPLLFSLFEYLHEAFPSIELIGDNDDPQAIHLTIGPNPDARAALYPSLIEGKSRTFLQGEGFRKEGLSQEHAIAMTDGTTHILLRCFLQQPNGILRVTITSSVSA